MGSERDRAEPVGLSRERLVAAGARGHGARRPRWPLDARAGRTARGQGGVALLARPGPPRAPRADRDRRPRPGAPARRPGRPGEPAPTAACGALDAALRSTARPCRAARRDARRARSGPRRGRGCAGPSRAAASRRPRRRALRRRCWPRSSSGASDRGRARPAEAAPIGHATVLVDTASIGVTLKAGRPGGPLAEAVPGPDGAASVSIQGRSVVVRRPRARRAIRGAPRPAVRLVRAGWRRHVAHAAPPRGPAAPRSQGRQRRRADRRGAAAPGRASSRSTSAAA